MLILILGLVIFFAVHLVPTAPGMRERLQRSFGDGAYLGLFAIASIIGFALIIYGYSVAPFVEVWSPPAAMRHVTLLFMLPVFPLLIAVYLPGTLKKKIPHPMLMAVKIWAFAHLLANGDMASALIFGSFMVYAIYALISVKKRQRAAGVSVRTGPVRNDLIAVVAGIAIYVAMVVYGHEAMIGVSLV